MAVVASSPLCASSSTRLRIGSRSLSNAAIRTSVSATTTGPSLADLADVIAQILDVLGRERVERGQGSLDSLLALGRRRAGRHGKAPQVRGERNALGLRAGTRDGELVRREADADHLLAELRLGHA